MILLKLLALPITAPVAGVRFCIEKVVDYAEQQLTDDEPVREQLLELHIELEEGRVTEDEYAEREAEYLRLVVSQQMAGLIISATRTGTDINALRRTGIQVVSVDRKTT